MSSREEVSYPILRAHDVDYVMIVFGGLIGYSGDDINKFLWCVYALALRASSCRCDRMIRIAEGIWPDEVKEANYFNRGEYRIDDGATATMRNSLMYKMRYADSLFRLVDAHLSLCTVTIGALCTSVLKTATDCVLASTICSRARDWIECATRKCQYLVRL